MNPEERIARIKEYASIEGGFDAPQEIVRFLLDQIEARDKFLAELPCPGCGQDAWYPSLGCRECTKPGAGTALDAFRKQK